MRRWKIVSEMNRLAQRSLLSHRPDPLVVGFALLGALLVAFVVSPLLGTLLGTSYQALLDTLADPEVLGSLGLTFYTAGLATAVALLTGVPLAYLLARHEFPGKQVVEGIIDLPMVLPHTAAGIALLMVFGRRAPLGRIGAEIGVQFVGTVPGIVVAMLFVSLPLLVSAAREAFVSVSAGMEHNAMALGATRWQAFLYITLPLAWRGIFSGALMMWARGVSEFGAVVILAYNPKIIPVLVYERFAGFGLAAARPVALILILMALGVFICLRILLHPLYESM